MIVGHEMLSRGPEGPLEIPDVFFQMSAERQILTEVDLHCLQRCLTAANSLPPGLWIHVNLYPSTIIEMPPERLIELFPDERKSGRFCIEIVEHQPVAALDILADHVGKLRESGIRLAIDDVGFGASMLESLLVLEPEILKIDRRYVNGVAGRPDRERYLKRLIDVGHALGSEMVAEGIETATDLELMKEMGVKFGQGFFWGKSA